ncbi:hypothetical protein [Candidatus Xiphinematobacter sp. Idaho Grape]|uniref:hypothetical protein n=1 Tax=Candidatus Xiphinematobacter sp. Idaho Grape TaxID=1704307 RepID=UPI000783DD4E|nr:hypothetical protein [Candidatus Xiphinematobacter sp. Idaho Grape]
MSIARGLCSLQKFTVLSGMVAPRLVAATYKPGSYYPHGRLLAASIVFGCVGKEAPLSIRILTVEMEVSSP